MTPGKEYKFTYTKGKEQKKKKKGIQYIEYTPEHPACSFVALTNKVVLQSEPHTPDAIMNNQGTLQVAHYASVNLPQGPLYHRSKTESGI